MAYEQDGRAVAGNAAVENANKAIRSCTVPRSSRNFSIAATTGTIAAALAANSSVFAMRLDPGAGSINAYIERIRLQYTTIVAYTTPVTAGRRLALYRGSGAAASSGTAITTVAKKDSGSIDSEIETAQGGDARIATTGALTVTGITFETNQIAEVSLTHVGAAGGFIEEVWGFSATKSAPIVLSPGQLIAIRNPAAMDAAGTWQLAVRVDWHEALAYSSTSADT